MKLHLGCGGVYKKGYINIDNNPDVKADRYLDLEKPLPFKNNFVDEVLASHVVEHLHNFLPFMRELSRICKKNAKVIIVTPFYSAWGQFNDPTHVRFFTPFTFRRYFEDFKVQKVKINFGIGVSSKMNWLFNPILNLNHRVYCRFFAFIFPASEIVFELKVIKNEKDKIFNQNKKEVLE